MLQGSSCRLQEEGSEPLDVQLQVLESVYTFAAGKLHTFKVSRICLLDIDSVCMRLHATTCNSHVYCTASLSVHLCACLHVCLAVHLSDCLGSRGKRGKQCVAPGKDHDTHRHV